MPYEGRGGTRLLLAEELRGVHLVQVLARRLHHPRQLVGPRDRVAARLVQDRVVRAAAPLRILLRALLLAHRVENGVELRKVGVQHGLVPQPLRLVPRGDGRRAAGLLGA
eukprot:2722104-Prymnesium_polylepis.1